jgi:hypothetical protein
MGQYPRFSCQTLVTLTPFHQLWCNRLEITAGADQEHKHAAKTRVSGMVNCASLSTAPNEICMYHAVASEHLARMKLLLVGILLDAAG